MSQAHTTPPPAVPGKAAIYAAIPGGSRRARSQRAYLAALVADPELADLRADARRAVLEVARVLTRWASWRTMTAWRPRARICAEVGSSRDPERPLSVSAFKRARQWLEGHGYLGLVEAASSPVFSPGILVNRDEPNRCPVFVLTTPRARCQIRKTSGDLPLNGPLATPRSGLAKAPRAHKAPKIKGETDRAAHGLPLLPRGRSALHHCPRTRGEALAVAAAVRARSRHLGNLSIEHLRHLGRVFFRAGWNGADLLAAVDHEPGGRQHGYVAAPRSPGRWAAYRLGLWLGPDGLPLPSRSQLAAADRRRVLAEQAGRQAERRAPAGYAAGAALARTLIAAKLGRARSLRGAQKLDSQDGSELPCGGRDLVGLREIASRVQDLDVRVNIRATGHRRDDVIDMNPREIGGERAGAPGAERSLPGREAP